ncbi:hypothetical protein CspHIS471_0502120 [Cutaneotrichosporon sp. HIS471]|nr:hypothetical protein CspHIS471_0502120 [Cutaneotrichosporon sp. HIS471]
MATPTTSAYDPFSDPIFSDILNNPFYSSILSGTAYQSMLSSVMADYSAIFTSMYPTATVVNTPTVTGPPARVTGTPQTGTAPDAAQGTTTVYHSATSAAKSSVPLGAIIGAVVGGVVTLVIIGTLIFCCRRRRKAMTERDFFIDDDHQPVHQVEPYAPITHPPAHPPQPYINEAKAMALSSGYLTSSSPSGFPSTSSTSYPSSPYVPHSYTSNPFSEPSAASYELPSQSKMPLNPVPMGPPVVEHALDGGAMPPPPPAKEILPPMYDPSWSGPGRQ